MGAMATVVRGAGRAAGPAADADAGAGAEAVPVSGRYAGIPRPSGIDGWTVSDLDDFPDDGLRYELIGGSLIVSPSPSRGHQDASRGLFRLLDAACPNGLEVYYAPLDWRPTEARSFQPDVLVVPRGPASAPVSDPVLVVEIASPSTAAVDRGFKFREYAAAWVPQYWIVEPGASDDGSDAAVEVYDLVGGEYVQQGSALGSETLNVTGPVAVAVVPADLVR